MIASEIQPYIESGHVKAYPNGELTLYHYTRKATVERKWDWPIRQCRGLVLDNYGAVVARPWPKFFNLGEIPETFPENIPNEVPELSEKYDGSLIICFYYMGNWQCVTSGCWDNVQTQWAKRWLCDYSDRLSPMMTYLFELVAPWNQIVVRYPTEKMILIGIVDPVTGVDLPYCQVRTQAQIMRLTPVEYHYSPISTFDKTLKTEREGYVARYSNGLRVKMKYDAYIALHKVITGLSIIGIWEHLANGSPEPELPNEFRDWYKTERGKLIDAYGRLECRAKTLLEGYQMRGSRKWYAERFNQYPELAPILFRMLDNKPYSDVIWRKVKPRGD